MGIIQFIQKVTVQTAVYWSPAGNDGYGGKTFADAVELTPPTNGVRWTDSTEVVSDKTGKEIVSRANVLVNSALEEEGYLYLGELDDLDSDPSPLDVDGAYQIARVDKTPLFKSTDEFVYTVYLYGKNQ